MTGTSDSEVFLEPLDRGLGYLLDEPRLHLRPSTKPVSFPLSLINSFNLIPLIIPLIPLINS